MPGEVISKKGELCNELFHLRQGKVKLIDPDTSEETLVAEGQTFNEMAFIFDSVQLHTAIAEDFCILDVLTRHDFDEVSQIRPEIKGNLKEGLKSLKATETSDIIRTLKSMKIFENFTSAELRRLFKEHMEVLYLNPGTLVMAPASKVNALYFVLKGTINRFAKSEANFEAIKVRLLGEEAVDTGDDYDSFIQQVDIEERFKTLEDRQPDAELLTGDWLGGSIGLTSSAAE